MKKQAFNPYLPSHEYIPDGEPRVFGGRLYVFGSHDRFGGGDYCQNDYVAWSAPVEDLADWRFEGVIYRKSQDPRGTNLYAPDVVQGPDGRFYLYYSPKDSSVIGVAVCDEPAGSYKYLGDVAYPDGRVLGVGPGEWYQFDPAVLVDGRQVWLYSGSGQLSMQKHFKQKMVGAMAIELQPDMITVKAAPKIVLPVRNKRIRPAFFEAASIRKIGELYYLVYFASLSGLHYCTSQYPDRDFVHCGCIHSASDIGINGHSLLHPAYPFGNNHGGLVCVDNQWYIFNHRTTNRSYFNRQGVAQPITIEADGTIKQVESTSCGLNGGPLRGQGSYPAHIACNLLGPHVLPGLRNPLRAPYITQDGGDREGEPGAYLTGMKNGGVAGYKYFDFKSGNNNGGTAVGKITLKARGDAEGMVRIAIDESDKRPIAVVPVHPSVQWCGFSGKFRINRGVLPLFFQFKGKGTLSLLEFTIQ